MWRKFSQTKRPRKRQNLYADRETPNPLSDIWDYTKKINSQSSDLPLAIAAPQPHPTHIPAVGLTGN